MFDIDSWGDRLGELHKKGKPIPEKDINAFLNWLSEINIDEHPLERPIIEQVQRYKKKAFVFYVLKLYNEWCEGK